jgi:antirestriction protein ArdC
MNQKQKKKFDIYEKINNQVLDLIEKTGVLPWSKKWTCLDDPKNLISDKIYRGMNYFLLKAIQGARQYNSNYWLTYKQAQGLDGSVMKGQKGTAICFWKLLDKERENAKGEIEEYKIPLLRYYTVFNLDQCENIDKSKIPELKKIEFNPIEECEKIIENLDEQPKIKFGGDQAFYNPKKDFIGLPERELFESEEYYYGVLFHELAHWTGHNSRLNRIDPMNNHFGSEKYSKEELIAELSSAYLCGLTNIEKVTIENSVAYIQNWFQRLASDKKLFITASQQAQKVIDYIT